MTVLVTGAGGFIGSHLVEALLRSGYTDRALVHYNSRGSRERLEELKTDWQTDSMCVSAISPIHI